MRGVRIIRERIGAVFERICEGMPFQCREVRRRAWWLIGFEGVEKARTLGRRDGFVLHREHLGQRNLPLDLEMEMQSTSLYIQVTYYRYSSNWV